MMRNQTAAFSGKTAAVRSRIGRAHGLLGQTALAALVASLLIAAGCGRSNEPKITGSRSDAPVSLACIWQPGYTYHLRLDTEILTETGDTDPDESSGRHRVSFGQECIVRVANTQRGNNVELELEITSLDMERAKNEGVALSFNSEQGGETVDEFGYIPALKKMVGGRLRFSISPGGKVIRFDGISEWLNNAVGTKPTTRTTTTATRVKTVMQKAPSGSSGSPQPFEVASEDIAFRAAELAVAPSPPNVQSLTVGATNRTFTVSPGNPVRSPSTNSGTDTVARTLRGFFNNELFRMLLEFRFLPTAAVRIGDEWKESGDTPITGRSGRVKYDAKCTFAGWQVRASNNCARIDAKGKGAAAQTPQTKSSRKTDRKSGLDGTVWVNANLQFPAATILDKESVFPGDTNTRQIGTNTVTTTTGPKYMRQHVIITLLKATPPEAPTPSADSSP